jgi:hypothetical protein
VGSVDAPALSVAPVEELEAPGHPPGLALDLTEDLGGSTQDVISPVRPCLEVPLEVVHVNDLEVDVSAGQHGFGCSHLVVDGSSVIGSVRARRLGSCQSSRADRWKSKPPVFKVYSRRRLSQAQIVQEDLLLQYVVEMIPPLEEFKSAVTKPSDGLLPPPPPRSTKRRKKAMPSDFRPRRSRRVAKFPRSLVQFRLLKCVGVWVFVMIMRIFLSRMPAIMQNYLILGFRVHTSLLWRLCLVGRCLKWGWTDWWCLGQRWQ